MATKKTSAKKTKAKSKPTAKKAVRSTPTKAPVAPEGPLTLEEAQQRVSLARPKRALRRAAGPVPTLDTLGQERDRLKKERKDERAQRLREYRDTMLLLKKRGVRRTVAAVPPGGRRRAPAKAPVSFQPLQVMAEGDSWFDYPYPFYGGGIIPRLQTRLGVPILNLASAGDEVRYMLGVEQRKRLMQTFTDGCPAGGAWDAVLFSGGGNDIVDNPMVLWTRDWQVGTLPSGLINQPRFDAALAMVRAGYEDLIALRDQLSPGTQLVFHGYDYAIPDGRGVCHHGPWLKPTFDLHKFPDRDSGFAVMKAMLQQFSAMLASLTAHPKVSVINTQGTLEPKPNSWHNELHPTKAGFETFAEMFHQHLKALFPTRVL